MLTQKLSTPPAQPQSSGWSLVVLVTALLSVRLVLYSLVAGGVHILPNALCRWDCGWYMSIVQTGYPKLPNAEPGATFDQASWAFFPVFPLLVGALRYVLGVSPLLAAVMVANISFGFFVFYAAKYVALINPAANKLACAIFISSFPSSFYFSIPYTESVYAALAIVSFWFLMRGRLLSASVFSAILSATRVTGVLLTPLFVWQYLTVIIKAIRNGETKAALHTLLASMLPIAVAPVGLFLYMLYLYVHVGDGFAFLDVQRAWGRSSQNPLTALWLGLESVDIISFAPFKSESGTIDALCASVALLFSIRLALLRRFGECWFLFASTVVPLTHGLGSLARYSLAQPIFLVYLFDFLWGLKCRLIFWVIIISCVPVQLLLVQLWVRGYAFLH